MSRFGGSFAPPMDDAKLASYYELAEKAPPAVRDEMQKLCRMMEVFGETPRSRQRGTPHPSGMGAIVPLEPAEIHRIDQHVPYEHECKMLTELFETLDPEEQRDLRNAAFHLLWFAVELCKDREPITNDQL